MENFVIRKAEQKDIEFVIEAIIEAEKSGSDKFVYSSIFELTEDEFRNILREILTDEIPGQKMYLPGFFVGEYNGEYAAAACSWIEGEEESSSTIAGKILAAYIDRDKIIKAQDKFQIINSLRLERFKGALQLESIYVRRKFRGKELAIKTLTEIIDARKKENPSLKLAQIIVATTNDNALNAYWKLGFAMVDEITDPSKGNLKIATVEFDSAVGETNLRIYD